MKKKYIIIFSSIVMLIIVMYVILFVMPNHNKSFDDYIDNTNNITTIVEENKDDSESNMEFRFAVTDKCLQEILDYEKVNEYDIMYIANATDTWVYYIYCNNHVWYIVEGVDNTYCQLEEYYTYDEVLQNIEEDRELLMQQ